MESTKHTGHTLESDMKKGIINAPPIPPTYPALPNQSIVFELRLRQAGKERERE